MERPYYSERAGRAPQPAQLNLQDLKQFFLTLYSDLEAQGYFQQYLGYTCVDSGFEPGIAGTDTKTELQLTLLRTTLWPVYSTIGNWSEDDCFDVIEFFFDRASKPKEWYDHSRFGCVRHCLAFNREEGQAEYRTKVNRVLRRYDKGFELSTAGEIQSLGDNGLEPLMHASLSIATSDNVKSRVETAVRRFRRHRASADDKHAAIRDLADVLEFLREKLKGVLLSKDEADLFNLANNFGIRHNNERQKTDYDKNIWFSWLFYYYLATIHAVTRLIEKAEQ